MAPMTANATAALSRYVRRQKRKFVKAAGITGTVIKIITIIAHPRDDDIDEPRFCPAGTVPTSGWTDAEFKESMDISAATGYRTCANAPFFWDYQPFWQCCSSLKSCFGESPSPQA